MLNLCCWAAPPLALFCVSVLLTDCLGFVLSCHPLRLFSCRRCLEKGAQFVLLGSGHSDGEFKAMAQQQFKDHKDVRWVLNGFEFF